MEALISGHVYLDLGSHAEWGGDRSMEALISGHGDRSMEAPRQALRLRGSPAPIPGHHSATFAGDRRFVPRGRSPAAQPLQDAPQRKGGARMFRHILCATDLSHSSKDALRYAVALARETGAALTVLHVVEPAVTPTPWFTRYSDTEAEFARKVVEREQAAARDVLATLVAEAQSGIGPEALKPSLVVRVGVVSDVILSTAAEVGADLVVVGTHGRRGLQHLLLGSIAERIVRTSPVPVLTVRPRDAAASSEKR